MHEDAPSVVGLKAAGAVIIGKTTTTEFGWKSPGDCPLHGITRNPWNPLYTTGGSSSGAGAAGAACFGPLHIGTDAGGSIRIPAAWCGLVGLKPSYGRIPQWPAGAFAAVACAGPMTRSRARRGADVLGDGALRRARSVLPARRSARLARRHRGRRGRADGRVVLRRPGFDAPVDRDGIAAVERAAALLQEAGATVSEAVPDLPDTRTIFGRVWGAALARLVGRPDAETSAALLDPGMLEVARPARRHDRIAFMDAEAMRVDGRPRDGRLHQRFDLVLCPTVPDRPPLADAPTVDPVTALWTTGRRGRSPST